MREIYFAGVLSLIIIVVSGLFVGMVLGLQGYETLQKYGSAEAVGTLVALSLTRELGPVVAALLFASRAGSAMTAEIGLMKATEQISAMEMMAVDPIARVIGPRFWGGVISMPLLAAMFSAVGVFGGYLITVVVIGVDEGAFWSQMQSAVDFRQDIVNGVIKSVVFGVAVTAIALFEGYDAPPTAEGVSRRDHAHRGHLVARDTGARFRADGIHVYGGLGDEPDRARLVGRRFRRRGHRGADGSRAQGRQRERRPTTWARPTRSSPTSTTSAGSSGARP